MLKTTSNAFTLAEVLVTLMIIGVIASMTIPALKKSADQKENIVGMKKAYSVLSQAVSLSEQENAPVKRWSMPAWDHANIYNTYLKGYLNVAKDCGVANDTACSGDPVLRADRAATAWASLYKIVLADGTRWAIEASGAEHFHVYADVNGNKKPNVLGVDVFMYTVSNKAFTDYAHKLPEAGVYYFGSGLDRPTMLTNCQTNGYTCGALIVIDGEKMNY